MSPWSYWGAPADAHEGRDEGPPFGVAQRAGWVEDLDVTVLLPVAGAVAAVVGFEGPCRCGEIVEAMLQVRLVLLDLYDQVIAGRLGDLDVFLTVHGVDGEDAAGQAERFDQGLDGWDLVRLLPDDFMSQDDPMIDGEGAQHMRRLSVSEGIKAAPERLAVDCNEARW